MSERSMVYYYMFQAEEQRNGSNYPGIKPRHQINLGWLRDASLMSAAFLATSTRPSAEKLTGLF